MGKKKTPPFRRRSFLVSRDSPCRSESLKVPFSIHVHQRDNPPSVGEEIWRIPPVWRLGGGVGHFSFLFFFLSLPSFGKSTERRLQSSPLSRGDAKKETARAEGALSRLG